MKTCVYLVLVQEKHSRLIISSSYSSWRYKPKKLRVFSFCVVSKIACRGGLDLSGYEYDDDDGDLSVDGDAVVSYPI